VRRAKHQRLGLREALSGLAALIACGILLVVINRSDVASHVSIALGIATLCVGLFGFLAGFLTAVSGILRIDRQTYLIVAATVLGVTAAALVWFALTFDPLF
jgi:hypothetical protein